MILLAGVVGQLAGVFDNANTLIGTEALPVPAMLVFVPLAAALAGIAALARVRLLSKPELVTVLFAVLIATPVMMVGFWRYQLSGLSTIVRVADWTKFEALPEGLWPHGGNLLGGVFDLRTGVTTSGAANIARGAASMAHAADSQLSTVRVRVELGAATASIDGTSPAVAVAGRPYLLTARVRAERLGADASYFIRLYADDDPTMASEPVSGRSEAKVTPLFADGATRVGAYAVELPASATDAVTIELGLRGKGKVTWNDLRLYDVRAIEWAYKGYRRVTEAEYASLSIAERQTVVVVPDALFSAEGLRYVSGLSYPVSDWVGPALRLGAFALLVFGATLGLSLLYQRQWLRNERYPLPMARPLLVLLGAAPADGGLGARFAKNPWLWLGFGGAFVWCALKVLHGYLPSLPDPSIEVGVKGYLAGAFWGRTWEGVELQVLALFLGLGLLMELNVLLSLVVGYLLFRMQYWFGHAQGLAEDQDFPYFPQQMLGAYWTYGLLVVVFTRKYLARTLRAGLALRPQDEDGRVSRTALLLLAGCTLGFAAWGIWLGAPLGAVALLGAQVVLLGFVGAKFMAECGLPAAGFNHPLGSPGNYNVPVEPMLLIPMLGSMPLFGGSGIMTMTIVTATVLPYGFFLIPGLQIQALEVGRRFGVRTREIAGATLLAAGAAIVIGGWIYLTSLYGFGAANFPDADHFNDRLGAFRVFNSEHAATQSALDAAGSQAAAPAPAAGQEKLWALGFGAGGAAVITTLRQLFPGFWFHPIGFLVGPSTMMEKLWGSLLVAYLVRWLVLRIGGAATVREKLVPAAVGIFLAALAGHALHILGNAIWFFFNKGTVKFTGLL